MCERVVCLKVGAAKLCFWFRFMGPAAVRTRTLDVLPGVAGTLDVVPGVSGRKDGLTVGFLNEGERVLLLPRREWRRDLTPSEVAFDWLFKTRFR